MTLGKYIFKSAAIAIALIHSSCDNSTDEHRNSTKLEYGDVSDGNFVGFSSSEIKAKLGDPDNIVDAGGRMIWNYGPSIEDMVHAAPGEIVGLTIYFDEEDKVKSIRAKTKTSVEETR